MCQAFASLWGNKWEQDAILEFMDFMISALAASSVSFFTCFLVLLEIQIAEIARCDLGILGVKSTQLTDSSPSSFPNYHLPHQLLGDTNHKVLCLGFNITWFLKNSLVD